eukprot:gb/GFBE01047925.1/.p1 GENE.gb/GFBE01047925.1/~~gb/GFBE01047925.1/.p1  ORF type:complete len:474 (+),score=92.04 gb/GFBE01047925.1/:1-1422(+)
MATTALEYEVDSNGPRCEVPKKLKKGGSIKWLAKCLFPNLQGKSKCSSSVVAPEPEPGSLADFAGAVRAGKSTVAWEVEEKPVEDRAKSSSCPASGDLRQTAEASAAENAAPALGELPAKEPEPVAAALAQSQALAAAIAGDSPEEPQRVASFAEVYSREGKEPLPMELLDEPLGAAAADLDIENVLPPLPVRDANKLDASGDIPGFAAQSPGLAADEEQDSLAPLRSSPDADAVPRARPVSFRARHGGAALPSPHKGSASPQKAGRRPGSGMFSLSSRPTTAGGESALALPPVRVSWQEQWTPGGDVYAAHATRSARAAACQPLPPPLPAPTPAASSSARIVDSIKQLELETDAILQDANMSPVSAAAPDPMELALKRASQRTTVQWAKAPTSNRSRWSSLKKGAVEKDQAADDTKVPAASPTASVKQASRPASAMSSRPATRELGQKRIGLDADLDFSELAVSFAALDDDM